MTELLSSQLESAEPSNQTCRFVFLDALRESVVSNCCVWARQKTRYSVRPPNRLVNIDGTSVRMTESRDYKPITQMLDRRKWELPARFVSP